ncbi:hypothetical protein CH379_009325 [Leptospira ellisii]|uniref:Phage tail tape measure protein n=1 Tax=Leptospira ellisii TaxID=2023197 RepID=A0A2N0BAY4_9LEPT|nr:hypothetical protein [Leptospira ellisii]MDV6235826.1 hypothetical protein [Leptospira ellisii]PJZ93687.1 hypothetical protein CH379_06545 [Leptospira ellisii]
MANRDVNVTIKISADSNDYFEGIRKEMETLRSGILDFSGVLSFVDERGSEVWKNFGASIGDTLRGASSLSLMASALGTTESNLDSLYSKVKGNAALEREFISLASSAGLSERQIAKLDFRLNAAAKTGAFLTAAFRNLAQASAVVFKEIVVPSFEAGIVLEKQNEVLKNLSGKAYPGLRDAILDAVRSSKGLSTLSGLSQAADEAIRMGMSVNFIERNLSGMQKASAAAGKDLSSSMKEVYSAIESGRDELFKNNGALFSEYLEDFKKINESALSAADKRIARERLVSSALRENSVLQNYYGSHVRSSSAILERFANELQDLKAIFGGFMLDALNPTLNLLADLYDYYIESEEGLESLKEGLIVFGSVLAGILTAVAVKMIILSGFTFGAMIPALVAMASAGWLAIAPWIPWIAVGAVVGLTIAAVVLTIRDLFKWLRGGKSVIFENLLGPFDQAKQKFDQFINFLGDWKDSIFKFFREIGNTVRESFRKMVPESVQSFLGISAELKEPAVEIQDAIITKQGKVIHFHPDDNLVAVKDLGVLGGARATKGGGGVSVNIANVVLGGSSTREDAKLFASYLEKELDKVALRIGFAAGVSPEGV